MSNQIEQDNKRIDLSELMPIGKDAKRILDERAFRYADVKNNLNSAVIQDNKYVTLKLGDDQYYGIMYEDILNIENIQHITPVPNLPPYVSGIQYWHGKIIAVIQLATFLNIAEPIKQKHNVLVINIQHQDIIVGFIFSDIIGIDNYSEQEIVKAIPEIVNVDNKYTLGIHHGNVCILNIKNILSDISDRIANIRGVSI